jgi:hypothetical protein
LFVVVLLAGCGRLQFDELAAVSPDAVPRACGVPDTAPATIRIDGQTFEYTSFNNTKRPVGLVSVTALDATTGTPLASDTSATSMAGAMYGVDVMTGGVPRRIAMRYATAGYFTTTSILDLDLAASTQGGQQPVWSFGDAPVWSTTTMGTIYMTSGEPLLPAKGTLNVAVRDCANAVIDGVSVTIDPPPGAVRYQASDGLPSMTLTETVLPFGHVLVLNAEPGLTRIIATKAGRTFLETEVTVLGGTNNTLAIVRAVD